MPSRAVTIYPHGPRITVLIGLDRYLQAVLGERFGQAGAPLHHGDRAARVGIQVQVVHLAEAAEPVGVRVHQGGPGPATGGCTRAMTNVGEVTGPRTPSPAPMPCASVV